MWDKDSWNDKDWMNTLRNESNASNKHINCRTSVSKRKECKPDRNGYMKCVTKVFETKKCDGQ